MERTACSRALVLSIALAMAVLIHAPVVEACMQSDCEIILCPAGCSCVDGQCQGTFCRDIEAESIFPAATSELIFTGPRQATIKIPGYVTTQLEPTTSCVTALSPVSGIERVDSIVNIDGRDDRPFEEVSFYYSSGPSPSIAQLAAEQGLVDEPTGEWHPFQSSITGTVHDGVPNYFLVNVTLEPGVSRSELRRALEREAFFLTSSSDPNGNPTPHHTSFRRLGAGHIVIREPEPTLSGAQTPRRRQQ